MLKKFFLNTLSSFAGAWLAIVTLVIAFVIFIIALIVNMASSTETTTYSLQKGSLLVVELSGVMEERVEDEAPNVMDLLYGDNTTLRSLEMYIGALEEAANNDNIKAVLLVCNGMAASPASLHEIRESLLKCQKNGKRIYAYANSMTQGDYYLASVSDNVYVNPQGSVELQGLGGYTPYFKSLLDKIGVQMQIVKVGTFKSAVEPYILDEMSEPARAQLDTLYTAIWTMYKDQIATSRKIEPSLIDTLINRDFILAKTPELAVKSKLIDGVKYQHEMEEMIAQYFDKSKFEDVNCVDINCMYDEYLRNKSTKGGEIAVVYAYGEIDGASGGIQSNEMVPLIQQLADDDDIKAMVLRVNSPGGSAFGSEQIWEALEQFKAKGKKLVVSMGDYAASGGYYISCGADKIYADEMTITGSIGIFGMIPCIDGLLHEKLGVNMQLVSTNPNGMFPSLYQPMTEEQYAALQEMIEQGYDTFTARVAAGRNMPQDKVKQIGEGRVWDAITAKRIGLVDELGSLQSAIECAAKLAGLDKYHTQAYPEINLGFWSIVNQMNTNSDIMAKYMSSEETFLLEQARQLLTRKPIQARMPEMIVRL